MERTLEQKERRAEVKRQTEATGVAWGMGALTPAQLVALLIEETPLVHWAASDHLIRRGPDSVDALIVGLTHADRKIRATCALLLDHVADDRCVEPLRHAMRHDPHESVRRCAMHSLICDGCKDCPLTVDVVGALLESALTDRSKEVRRRAVFYLSQQRPDARVRPTLESLLTRENDSVVRQRAQEVLERQVL